MFYEFEEEIKLLNKSNVKDKERIIYIYTDFYKEIIGITVFIDIYHKQIFEEALSRIFQETIVSAESNDYANYYNFIKAILNKTNKLIFDIHYQEEKQNPYWDSSLRTIDNYWSKIASSNNNEYLNRINFIIDIFNISLSKTDFYTRIHIMLYLKEQINKFTRTYNVVYNPVHTNKNAEKAIKIFTSRLIRLLPNILKKSYGFEDFYHNLQKETYLLLQKEFELKNPDFINFNTYVFKDYYDTLDSNSKNIFNELICEYISGYTGIINLKGSLFERIKQGHTRRKIKRELARYGYK